MREPSGGRALPGPNTARRSVEGHQGRRRCRRSSSSAGWAGTCGSVDAPLIDPNLQVSSTTTDGNQLRDVLLGGVFQPVGDAILVGGVTSAGFFSGGSQSIGISSGIVLTTGDARMVEGPNTDDGSTGFASELGDADLDTPALPGGARYRRGD